jgi:ketosteroid isomerase-like protein
MPDVPALTIEDELAIRSMFARYVHLLDGGDAKGWGNLFTEDGSWTRVNSPSRQLGGSGLPAETVRGRENLVQMAFDVVQKRFNGLCRHQMTDVYVEAGAHPDVAHGMSRALITDWNDGPGKLAMVGDYRLEFARTPQGWRIRSIECTLVPG